MRRRNILNLCIQVSVLTVLALLYGLSLYTHMPAYWESIMLSAALTVLFGTALVRFIPQLVSMLVGDAEAHMAREGDRTYRRCGTRELGKLFLLVLIVRLFEFPLTYIMRFALFGYTGTFFEVQRLWLDFYHAETAFPLFDLLSRPFWVFTYNFNHARFIGSYVFTSMAVVALYYLVQLDYDRRIARRSVRYMLLMPFSFALMGTVPDGLFLLLSILCLLFLRKQRFIIANVFAMLATATHALGVLLFVPILITFINLLVGNIRSNREMGKGYFLKQVGNGVSLLLIPLGVGAVMLYAKLRFGDAMSLYRYALGTPGLGAEGILRYADEAVIQSLFIGNHAGAKLLGTYLPQLLYFVFALVMLLLANGTVPTAYVALMAVTLPMIVLTGHVGDTAKIVTMTAPFVLTLAVRIKRKWVDALVTALLGALWLVYFYAFIAGYAGGIG